jgi:type II secretory pathway pseudopilin PulG
MISQILRIPSPSDGYEGPVAPRAWGKIVADDRAFTVIEVLLAFVILAISLSVATEAISHAATQIQITEEADELRQLAEQTLAAALVSTATNEQGFIKEPGYTWQWSRTSINRQDDAVPLLPVYLVVAKARSSRTDAEITLKTATFGLNRP